jgi:hypothetical protein
VEKSRRRLEALDSASAAFYQRLICYAPSPSRMAAKTGAHLPPQYSIRGHSHKQFFKRAGSGRRHALPRE